MSNVEKLQKKLAQLNQERDNVQATLFGYNGAITIVQQLLQEELVTGAQTPPPAPISTVAKQAKTLTVVPANAKTE